MKYKNNKLLLTDIFLIKNKSNIIKKFGYPVLSKEIAHKIESLQNPTIRNETVRKAIVTGNTGKRGGYKNRGKKTQSHSLNQNLPLKRKS